MPTLEEHEHKKKLLKQHLKNLDDNCRRKYGPLNKADFNAEDPYKTFLTVKNYTTNNKTKCKFMAGTSVRKDSENRYFEKPRYEKECTDVKGVWDDNAINRFNKVDDGNCWVGADDQVCGSIVSDSRLLIPGYSKYRPGDMQEVITNTSKKCNEQAGCEFKQLTAYTYDCVKKDVKDASGKSAKKDEDTSIPPEDMPLYMFEEYLENWYSKSKPRPAPKTANLIGKGDRCNKGPQTEEDIEEEDLPPSSFHYIDFSELDYTNEENISLLQKILEKISKNHFFNSYVKDALRKGYHHHDIIQHIFEKADEYQYNTDYKVNLKLKVSDEKMLPSIPQSVINMVMKRSAIAESKKRGLLAWHSTGAGKCHAKDTPIMMYDGRIKMVQDINVGDLLMGDDSSPRMVLSLGRGQDMMYDIIPSKGDKYTVNSEHILCLKSKKDGSIKEISVLDYLNLDKTDQSSYCGYKVPVNFVNTEHFFDIYSSALAIFNSNVDTIPPYYIMSKFTDRMNFLAGAIDTCGNIVDGRYQCSMRQELRSDFMFLCRSLGYAAYADKGYIEISGNLKEIPVKHFNTELLSHDENALLVDIEVKKSHVDDYYGFTLNGNHRYVLGDFTVTHNTAVATGIIDAFWDTDKKIIFVSSNDAIASNPEFVFHKLAMNLFERFQRFPFLGKDEAETMTKISAAFKMRKIRFLSFAKLANRLSPTHKEHIKLDECVLIIDEVHNLFRPLPNQRKQHELLEAHLVGQKYKHPGMKVIILTATPGDNVKDVLKLINIVRDYGSPQIQAPDYNDAASIEKFQNEIRGLISYLELSKDNTKFPTITDMPPMRLPISAHQMKKYEEAYKTVKGAQLNYDELAKKNNLEKYWAPARKYANSLFSFEKKMSLHEFSSKIPKVIELLKTYSEDKHYLYSSFYTKMGYGGHGVIGIAKTLDNEGYSKLTYEEAKKLNKAGKLPPKGKRYILVINTELGTKQGENLHELLKIYNHPENKNGDLIKIMLASNKYNESIDLKDVSHIHLFEPLVTMASEKQAIGRAVRFCSFANKNRANGEWNVKIHRYFMDIPPMEVGKGGKKANIENIDDKIFAESRERFKELFTIYKCMRESAIDCRLLKAFHEHTGEKINCKF